MNTLDKAKSIAREHHGSIDELSDETLIQRYKDAAGLVSYYNAAEGNNYRSEGQARAKAREKYFIVANEMSKRGLDLPRGYLI